MGQMGVEGNRSVGRPGQGSGRELLRVVLLLAVLHRMAPPAGSATAGAPRPQAEGDSANTLPVNVTIHVGKRAEFLCGAPLGNVTTFTVDDGHNTSLSLNCHWGEKDTEPLDFHKFEGRCVLDPRPQAVWAVNSAAMSHNGYTFTCSWPNGPSTVLPAFLTVYDDASSFGIIIGCTVGGFFTTLLFFAVAFRVIKKSERLQQCLRGEEEEVEDDITMVCRE